MRAERYAPVGRRGNGRAIEIAADNSVGSAVVADAAFSIETADAGCCTQPQFSVGVVAEGPHARACESVAGTNDCVDAHGIVDKGEATRPVGSPYSRREDLL